MSKKTRNDLSGFKKEIDGLNKSLDEFKADFEKLSDDDKKWVADELLKRDLLEDKK
ncbi:hypothetical protein N9T76_00325 [Pseudomonadota bacterium]|jgi:hypothetical protein|nr:hypothetical protein [Pseudomonadota bacterium]|tara:strand:- start:647 stop:814 length:168 start_codon:yes stop_codon:yes gene_type:complete